MLDSRSSTAALEPNSRLRLGALTLLLQPALFLAGCSSGKPPAAPSATASPRPPATSTAPAAAAAPAAPAPATGAAPAAAPTAAPAAPPGGAAGLREEQRWLQSWFEGTPVRIALSGSNALAVEVPREFCFDAGRSQVKPALAAVLDKVAESLRRHAQNKLTLLAAPADAVAAAPVATARAAALYKHLRTRGVPAPRLAEPSTTVASAVQLRIEAPPF